MRGRKPVSYSLKVAQGNPGHDALPISVRAPEGAFDPPFQLEGDALVEWERIRLQAHWVRASDAVALADRCLCFARLLAAERDISDRGHTVKPRNGMVSNPSVRNARNYRAALQRYDAELGLTSTSRERIHTTEKDRAGAMDNELAAILAQPRTPRVIPQ